VHVSGHACSEELRTLLSLLRPRRSCRCTASSHAGGARPARARRRRARRLDRARRERVGGRALAQRGRDRDEVAAGRDLRRRVGVGDVHDVALRDRRRLFRGRRPHHRRHSCRRDGGSAGPPELIARASATTRAARTSSGSRPTAFSSSALAEDISEIKLLQEHLHDEVGQLVYDRTHRRPMILPVGGGGLMSTLRAREPGWADVDRGSRGRLEHVRRLIGQLGACEGGGARVLPLLERWARATLPFDGRRAGGCSAPCGGPGRDGARGSRAAADRYLLELGGRPRGGPLLVWRPGAGELLEWSRCSSVAGRERLPDEGRAVVLELAVLVRALQASQTWPGSRRRGPLLVWAGPLRPAREPRAGGGRPARDRRLKDARPG